MGLSLRCRRLPAAAQADRGGRLMAKVPAFAKAFAGRWRIVEMDVWDNDFLDLVETAHLITQRTSGLVFLLQNFGRLPCAEIGPTQQGHRDSVATRAKINLRRIVAMEFGTWRS